MWIKKTPSSLPIRYAKFHAYLQTRLKIPNSRNKSWAKYSISIRNPTLSWLPTCIIVFPFEFIIKASHSQIHSAQSPSLNKAFSVVIVEKTSGQLQPNIEYIFSRWRYNPALENCFFFLRNGDEGLRHYIEYYLVMLTIKSEARKVSGRSNA